ncbi:GntR family transcriptional regulator [Kocuria sp. CNJ-770]|uniref:GntR family transcriptional regulator n=1 Tax=Kocuria sp. CNJ-770 TaxID=1904964 RepID=UPI000AF89786|nr:GntR family transcriptional regulator [Kocuria sp. CNJ-770]
MAGVTKYHMIRDHLLDRLDSMAAGEQLPTERDLAQELGVSRMTLRRATDELVAGGLVRRRPGAGVFAVGPKLDTALAATSFTQDMLSRGLRPGSRMLAFERRAAGARIGRRLEVSPSADVVHATRLRLADEEPMSIETLYVPESVVPGLTVDDLEDASYYELLRLRYGVVIARGVQTIQPTVTDEEESRELGVPLHSPALLFERTSWAADGTVVEFVRSIYRGDRYQIRTELTVPRTAAPVQETTG